jgi:hypothetical protein
MYLGGCKIRYGKFLNILQKPAVTSETSVIAGIGRFQNN